MSGTPTVTLARGDGIGPEITDAVLTILDAADADLAYEEIQIGESQLLAGHKSGIAPDTWTVIRKNPVFLKAPITTPLGGGYKSLNVTIRKSLNLFANVRPTRSYAPFVPCVFPKMNLVIVRENEEDLYAGIEHQQTEEVTQVLKLITRPGTERIVRYAFEYARAHGRKHVTCMTKNNIMKHTDGLFARVFQEIAAEYDDIGRDHQIIDIGAARVAAQPDAFDVIVTLNLYGDILSDIASQVAGSVGLAGSANVGEHVSMFEAVHGSAPDIAGKNLANPSGLLAGAIQMLVHLGQFDVAERVENAWLATLEAGVHTGDLHHESRSTKLVGTHEFARAVADRMGEGPATLQAARYDGAALTVPSGTPAPHTGNKSLQGVDAFIDWRGASRDPNIIGKGLEAASNGWRLKMITNRGVKVYPGGIPETFCTDHWRCRFLPLEGASVTNRDIITLLQDLHEAGYDVIKTENLYNFGGAR
ncbi:MAG: NADP-dependent isocitrate dehydrogenase, partial [Myxococcota bacterium]